MNFYTKYMLLWTSGDETGEPIYLSSPAAAGCLLRSNLNSRLKLKIGNEKAFVLHELGLHGQRGIATRIVPPEWPDHIGTQKGLH